MEPQSGTPLNRLAGESSPYLLQHAGNPVDWYPWGREAWDKAVRENKPVFLSIGYSACHWCHVMERESFADAGVAALMNELFVNVKVDREERPDVDAVYMKAVIALTGHGGWPLSVFLTPDRKPYLGGTYFPSQPRHGRPAFAEVLRRAADLYRSGTGATGARAEALLQRMAPRDDAAPPGALNTEEIIREAVAIMAEKFDSAYGGFGAGAKFPETMSLGLLLRHWLRTGDSESVLMVDKTLTRMAEGGMYDQLGGGFHRYATDRKWRVPHFEKMLYDNALLARLYIETWQATKQDLHKTVALEIFSYVAREMTSPEGGFYSSQDADGEGGEGSYYLWQLKEVLEHLGPRHAGIFSRHYGITAAGNFEQKNILHVREPMEAVAEATETPIFEVGHIIRNGRKALLELRERRPRPARDEKILAAWNGMMIGALAAGYSVLRERHCLEAAVRCGEFIWNRLWTSEGLNRVRGQGDKVVPGFLDDHAWLLDGYLALYEATFDPLWITRGQKLADAMIELFADTAGGFIFAGGRHDPMIVRIKTGADEAYASANAVATLALLRLGDITGNAGYRRRGESALTAFQGAIRQRPAAHCGFLAVADYLSRPTLEIVFAGSAGDVAFEELVSAAHQDFRPNKLVMRAGGDDLIAPARGKEKTPQGQATVYVCKDGTCHAPVHSPAALTDLLGRPPVIKLNIFDEDKARSEKSARETANFLNVMGGIFEQSGLMKKKKNPS